MKDDDITFEPPKNLWWDKGRYKKTSSGYVIDRRVFRIAFLLAMIPGVFGFFIGGFDDLINTHVTCDSDVPCKNPCYQSGRLACVGFTDQEFLQPGFEKGKPPRGWSEVMNIWPAWLIAVFAIAFGLNDIVNNRRDY